MCGACEVVKKLDGWGEEVLGVSRWMGCSGSRVSCEFEVFTDVRLGGDRAKDVEFGRCRREVGLALLG